MKKARSSIMLGLGFSGLVALSGCDEVRTSDQAVEVAKRACADVIYHGSFPPKPGDKLSWAAHPQNLQTGKGDGWLVASSYDDSGPGVGSEPPHMAYIRIEVFVPRNGKLTPSDCVGTVD